MIDLTKFKQKLAKGFEKGANVYGEQLQESPKLTIWDWTRETTRRSGEVVSSPRDIFDLGNLYGSYELIYEQNIPTLEIYAKFRWNAPYSAYVYFGVTYSTGVTAPARKWGEYTEKQTPAISYIAKYVKAELSQAA